jgi:hypothetical protein
MKKIEMAVITLLLIGVGFAAAQTETTYYCYDDGTWSVCTPAEAIHAEETMTRETPGMLTSGEMEALLRSHEPFWKYYFSPSPGEITPAPTPTPVPTPRPTQAPEGYWKSIIRNKYPARNYTLPFSWRSTDDQASCTNDWQCVPAQCCHPASCINSLYRQPCMGTICTSVCEGPVDCGAGHCGCVDGKCQVIPGPG